MKRTKRAKGTVQLQIKICVHCGETFIGVVGLPYTCKDGSHLIKMDALQKMAYRPETPK